ncbi:uncharacterized [Tachysurus ichikawai]
MRWRRWGYVCRGVYCGFQRRKEHCEDTRKSYTGLNWHGAEQQRASYSKCQQGDLLVTRFNTNMTGGWLPDLSLLADKEHHNIHNTALE